MNATTPRDSLRLGVRIALCATLAAAAAPAWAQEAPRPGHPNEVTITSFLDGNTFLLLLFVIGGTMAWATWRARSRPSLLPRFTDRNFESDVLGAQMPVLVHFSQHWNIGDKAAIAQTEILAYKNRGAVQVGMLDIESNPLTTARFPGIEAPAYLLFYKGRKLFHRWGLAQAEDIQKEIDVALSREGF